ncbi:MAG TPA: response regulator, partial [Caldithrix abyssi]|nr:response regulator [Caldithrix abyssi]
MTFEKKTILIVEDDRDMRKLLKMYLNHNSYQIIEATSGDEGLNILNNTIPDLIICDIMMPGMDGYELRKKILRNEKLRLVPFVFLSAKGLNKDIIEGFKLFADAYISKPFDPEILKVQVNTLLEKYTEINRL